MCSALSERTKQVQFRMPEELHTELKAALALEKSSFTDFFNRAAVEFLSAQGRKKKKKKKPAHGEGDAHHG